MQTINTPGLDVETILYFLFWTLFDLPVKAYKSLTQGGNQGELSVLASDFYRSLFIVSSVLCILFLVGIVYALVRAWQIRSAEEYELKHPKSAQALSVSTEEPGKIGSLKWQVVERHISSSNSGDWRLAVLEADIMLDDMVRGFGYEGTNLGERLKATSRASFLTLDQAWEAHKIRNAIAHEGAGFELSQREARRVINLFRAVFEEFNYI